MPAASALRDVAAALTDAAERIHLSHRAATAHRRQAREDAEELLEVILGDEPHDGRLRRSEARRYRELVRRRVDGEPLALIRGHVDFFGLRLETHRGVFAPRPSSEMLARAAIARLRRRLAPVHVDVATGLGPVAIAVAHSVRRARVYGLDLSGSAVRAARSNARALGVDNVRFRRGDLLAPLPARLRGSVDVITAHPPYIPRGELRSLPVELRKHEPLTTLSDGSDDGLGMVRRLAGESPEWLCAGGWLLLELAPDRARRAAPILRRTMHRVDVLGDRTWPTRIVAGRA